MDIVTGRRHWPPKGVRGAQMDKGGTHAQQLSLKKAKTKPQKKAWPTSVWDVEWGCCPPASAVHLLVFQFQFFWPISSRGIPNKGMPSYSAILNLEIKDDPKFCVFTMIFIFK